MSCLINGSSSVKNIVEITLNMTSEDLVILPNAARSYGDISAGAIYSDLFLLFGGYMLMFFYTIMMLGRINFVEIRMMLSMAGMVSIGMGISIAISIR